MVRVPKGSTLEESIAFYSRRVGDCLIWTGSTDRDGYAKLKFRGKTIRVSRYVLERKRGRRLGRLFALHSCDTPQCIEADHLFPGTAKSNADDMMAKGRHDCGRGERQHCAKLTAQQVVTIRSMAGTQREIAAHFGVDQSAISHIRNRKSWRHVP